MKKIFSIILIVFSPVLILAQETEEQDLFHFDLTILETWCRLPAPGWKELPGSQRSNER